MGKTDLLRPRPPRNTRVEKKLQVAICRPFVLASLALVTATALSACASPRPKVARNSPRVRAVPGSRDRVSLTADDARSDAGSESVALLRASDDITVTQVFAVADALRREGTVHIVLGLVGTSVGPPDDAWASCPFPSTADAQEIEGGFAQLEVEWDDEGRAGVVRVVSSSGHGFGGAAVLCALWQRSSSTQQCAGITQPCKQRVRVNFKRR